MSPLPIEEDKKRLYLEHKSSSYMGNGKSSNKYDSHKSNVELKEESFLKEDCEPTFDASFKKYLNNKEIIPVFHSCNEDNICLIPFEHHNHPCNVNLSMKQSNLMLLDLPKKEKCSYSIEALLKKDKLGQSSRN